MATAERVYVRTTDGSPTVVSSRRSNPFARLCRKQRIASLADARAVGLIPAFVDLPALEEHAGRVLADTKIARDAESRVRGTAAPGPGRTAAGSERIVQARIAHETNQLRTSALATTIEPLLQPRARELVAGRAVSILTSRPFDLAILDVRQDLDVYTDLVLAADIGLAEFGDVRVFRGARIVGEASHLVFRASRVDGNLLDVVAEHTGAVAGTNITDFVRS